VTRRLPAVDAEVGEALPDPPGDVQCGALPDGDDGGGAGLVDHLVHQPVHRLEHRDLLGQPGFQPPDGQRLSRDDPLRVRAQRRLID
jgi:hypothetical protein